ncbi:unnamed protein product, partial [Prorocentrum cordatum]
MGKRYGQARRPAVWPSAGGPPRVARGPYAGAAWSLPCVKAGMANDDLYLGFLSETSGIFIMVIWAIVRAVVFLTTLSSREELEVVGVILHPHLQTFLMTYACVGIYLAILAGFREVTKLSILHLERFYVFSLFTAFIDAYLVFRIATEGRVCTAFVDLRWLRRGAMFVCTFVRFQLSLWSSLYIGFMFLNTWSLFKWIQKKVTVGTRSCLCGMARRSLRLTRTESTALRRAEPTESDTRPNID